MHKFVLFALFFESDVVEARYYATYFGPHLLYLLLHFTAYSCFCYNLVLEKLPSVEFRLSQDEYYISSLASKLNCAGELAFNLLVTISPE